MLSNENVSHAKGEYVSLPPIPSVLIESLRSIGYIMETALADIIDNSVTAMAGRISVRFQWNNGDPWIAIIDDGYGMEKETLVQAMRFGSNAPSSSRLNNDLGRFGLGMKTASISQCRRVTVCSKRDKLTSCCEWDLDDFYNSNSQEWMLKVIDTSTSADDDVLWCLLEESLSTQESGTIVLWRNLDSILQGKDTVLNEVKFNDVMYHSRKHIETVFHRFISPEHGTKAIEIDFNNNLLQSFNPFGPSIPSRQELPLETINIYGEEVFIQPYILPHRNKVCQQEYDLYAGEEGYLQNQGFYIYRNRRLIMKSTWFRLIRKEELNKLIRVRIDIPNSLDHLWGINIDKSEVTPPEIVKKHLRKIIQKISGRGKRVFKQRATKLTSTGLVPLWNRIVKDGRVTYSINFQHPIMSRILDVLDELTSKRLMSCLDMITSCFPYDVYYSDVASDDVEINKIVDEDSIRDLIVELVKSFRICGIKRDEIAAKIDSIEMPSFKQSSIDDIISEVYDDNSK